MGKAGMVRLVGPRRLAQIRQGMPFSYPLRLFPRRIHPEPSLTPYSPSPATERPIRGAHRTFPGDETDEAELAATPPTIGRELLEKTIVHHQNPTASLWSQFFSASFTVSLISFRVIVLDVRASVVFCGRNGSAARPL